MSAITALFLGGEEAVMARLLVLREIGARGEAPQWTPAEIENRTSFERTALEYGLRDGVIWLPGFAPSWWKRAMLKLLNFQPEPALIACDPDPAGIEIALDAGSVWQNTGLSWQPWNMNTSFLSALPRRKPLTERDRQRLAVLRSGNLPSDLGVMAAWMEMHGEKGEQEGLL